MQFKDIQKDDNQSEQEDKRIRKPGDIIEDIKKIITATEIGKATITSVETPECDVAARAVSEDMQEKEVIEEK